MKKENKRDSIRIILSNLYLAGACMRTMEDFNYDKDAVMKNIIKRVDEAYKALKSYGLV